MKLTKRQLRRIIKEEKAKLLQEAFPGGWDGSYGGSVREGSDVMELVSDQFAELQEQLQLVLDEALKDYPEINIDFVIEGPPDFWPRLNSYINDVERAAKGEGLDD